MPFINVKQEAPKRDFWELDKIICNEVLPIINPMIPEFLGNTNYAILPNGEPYTYYPQEKGPMQNKDHSQYFALSCLDVGLSYSEIGLWIDSCMGKGQRKHSDGIERMISTEASSIIRLDETKPIYRFPEDGEYKRNLVIELV